MAGINLTMVHTKNKSFLPHSQHNDPSCITLVNISAPISLIKKFSGVQV